MYTVNIFHYNPESGLWNSGSYVLPFGSKISDLSTNTLYLGEGFEGVLHFFEVLNGTYGFQNEFNNWHVNACPAGCSFIQCHG